ncbi:MAG: peptide deformylase [Phascolarctobacterium sp.]|nr:peptide deformylase [Candidatus Phascolarctobacterium caballi]MCQ2381062.1 peptide deformylase [Acidaminococcaceae bacterium]
MAILKIMHAGNPVLRKVAEPVKKIDKRITRLLTNMAETMYAADGVGLAAPQIGESKRMVVIDVGDGVLLEMINPVITKREGSVVDMEGCLSVPDYNGTVERSATVECEFTNRQGELVKLTATELLARAIQHEIDHLDGILFIDKAQTIEPREMKDE